VSLSPGTRLGPYEIQALLGRGGMGEVYRALDTRLHREVAIKILPGALTSDAESVRRFQNEARAVASLSHPNVVPLFDVGEQDGMRYAVTELVLGETLRVRLANAPLPVPEAVEIAAGVAEGLTAAHEKGVVHRDVKPENIVLTASGSPRILDFGLAKQSAIAQPASDEEPTRSALLSEPGVISGTVGYMSPEQVRGEALDGRSDLFSLGVVLYEMLTSRRPFRGESQVETMNAILKEEPPPDPAVAALPVELDRILRRCMAKRRENRYHSAADLAHDLRNSLTATSSGATSAPVPAAGRRSRLPWIAAAVAGLAIVLAGVFLLDRRKTASPSASPRTLAVLPFRAISAEGMPERFGLGLADSLIGRLAAVRELTVRPTSAITKYETSPAGAADAGRELEVDAVLEGTYQKLEGVTRVSVQMTDVARAAILWSDRIELPEGRLFELQDEISNRIVERLAVRLAPEEKRALKKSQAVPDHVTQEYLAARARLPGVYAGTPEHRAEVIAAFDRILDVQPDFAPAIGARAYARAWLTFVRPTQENYRAALADAERAVALDPDLAEPRVARASLAWSSLGGWDVPTAVGNLQEALALAPNLEIAHLDLARVAYHSGWIQEARRALDEASRLNPSGEAARIATAMAAWLEESRKSLARFQSLPAEMQSSWITRWQILWLRATLDDPATVIPDAEALYRETPDPVVAAILAVARARAGQETAQLEAGIARADQRVGHFHHVLHFLADVHAIRKDTGGAIRLLREASDAGFPCIPCFENDALLAGVRASDGYKTFRDEVTRRNAAVRAALKRPL
jgi:serine/threonine protein kinase/tetratricopeptide (TPR) repeat protein